VPTAGSSAAQRKNVYIGWIVIGIIAFLTLAALAALRINRRPGTLQNVAELPAAAPPPRAPKVYSASDLNVVPPMTLNQQIPAFRGQIREVQTGVIEVLLDTVGGVESATMVMPINPQYDRMALNAAKAWSYQPARVDGVPVKFLKRIQVNLVPTNGN